jgi:uncharacterized protein YlxP (DUF503 family)
MHVFSARFHLHLPTHNLKDKRGIVKSILARARNNFNVASAEIGMQDVHGVAQLGFVTLSESNVRGRQTLERLEEWIVESRPDVEVVDVDIEEL